MIAFVLAGGNGMRVWPAAETRNKAALPVGNTPLVRRVVEQLFEIGVENVVVGIGHHAPSVRHALHGLESSRVRFVETSRENGTAAAVARMLADTAVESDFLVVYGDVSTTAA
ncbi:MAG: NTP transferase domain-containing protein, partial [Armatimonadaceae bacterium]